MAQYELIRGIEIDRHLRRFVEDEVLPGTGFEPSGFWFGFSALIRDLTPENKRLLQVREDLQARIDARNMAQMGHVPSPAEEEEFLREIGYIVDPPAPFTIGTADVDAEIAAIAGPQLVVPASNARYALNATNARWGSLYDALYGSDALGDPPRPGCYDPARGDRVVEWGRDFLDRIAPLTGGSHRDVTDYRVQDAKLMTDRGGLANPSLLSAWCEGAILLRHHDLHVELVISPNSPIGRRDKAGISDIQLESAVTAIIDLEDSVAAVDASDKILVYRNWLGLMKGTLSACFTKRGVDVERRLTPDRDYTTSAGGNLSLKSGALLLVRNVGHLMTNPMMCIDGQEVHEGLVDAVLTSLIALHDINGQRRNSGAGSIYIVKPKMHGPAEAAFSNCLLNRVEDLLGLPRNTIKIGVMDEERRTSVNLAATIHAVRDRVAFINTGFLDRTGDEIHTSMRLGPVVRKAEMKSAGWLTTYESRNVAVGLACGFPGRAQIGKGMWAMPDRMADMLREKIAHPLAGASTAWVPSPTAATLHAIHYHEVDVVRRQTELANSPPAPLDCMLALPVDLQRNWTTDEVREELENNLQGILGYAVRWIEQGIGCSKVLDVHEVGLMEDRATCRISSQHVANWLFHGVLTPKNVEKALHRMARVVDRQNADDPSYRPMALSPDKSYAFRAARALVFAGAEQPSGYTEPLLHAWRLRLKSHSMTPDELGLS